MGRRDKLSKNLPEVDEKVESPNAIDEIFNEREDFILVGFTGGTGAGCTTAAKILGKHLMN